MKIKATFADGRTITRATDRVYSHAWRVTGEWGGKPQDVTGFSRNYALACKAAAVYTAPRACWINPKVEIAEVKPQ